MDSVPQYQTRYTESNRRELVKEFQTHLHRGKIPMAQDLRSTIDKWDLMKLKRFCKTKGGIISTTRQRKVGKNSSLTVLPTGG